MSDQTMEDLQRGAQMIEATKALTKILESKTEGQVELASVGPKGAKVLSYVMTFKVGDGDVTVNVPSSCAGAFASKILPNEVDGSDPSVAHPVAFDRSVND